MSIARHHTEWLSLVPVSGPFLSLPVLMEAFNTGLEPHDPDHMRLLRQEHAAWLNFLEKRKADPAQHYNWIKFVLTNTLELDDRVLLEGQAIPQTLQVEVPEHHEFLRPSFVLNDPGTSKPRLLIQTYPRSQELTSYVAGSSWKASPDTRMTELLHGTGVRLGLVTNGEHWMLVDAPKGETTGYASWYASLWLEEPITLRAFRSLLSVSRFFNVPDDQTLEALLKKSASNQQEVTDQLGYQVRRAVEVLIYSLDRADQDHGRALLQGVPDAVLYESALTVMMRLVFLFCAEERELIPSKPFPVYEENYSVSTISKQLRELADQHGEELLERRFDAWTRLLAAFRAVYGGLKHDDVHIPAYGGSLFNPDRFPFLEGRKQDTTWRDTEANPLPVNNRTVLHLLEALQLLQIKVPGGGPAEARRLSFRALDIEQIGHVYEGLLDHTAKRASEPYLGLAGTREKEPEVPLAELEKVFEKGESELFKFLKEETGKTENAARKALTAELDSQQKARFRTACQGDDSLWKRVEPLAGLVRTDNFGYPVVIPTGSVFVTAGTDRRSSGTHYTPRSLTEPIVQYTLEPLVYVGPAEGLPKNEWKLKPAKELLELKICDMACGSGAFLVQAARYMAERLMESWDNAKKENPDTPGITPEGLESTGSPNEAIIPDDPAERKTFAMRLVAQRCLYGVDKNPLAVEMAKLSLWLLTVAKEKPFEFLDHSIKCGDSLVGLHTLDQLRHFSLKPESDKAVLYGGPLDEEVAEAIQLRLQLESLPANTVEEVQRQEKLLKKANDQTAMLKCSADMLVAAEFWVESARDKTERVRHNAVRTTYYLDQCKKADEKARATEEFQSVAAKERRGQSMFHWPLEFPEVVVKRGGFDAIVGNPPFMGGSKITGSLGDDYRRYLVEYVADGFRGNADLCSYFFLRAFTLLVDRGNLGAVATNTIAQGETREVGLSRLFWKGMQSYRAESSCKWPGTASLEISQVWLHLGRWDGISTLNGVAVNEISSYLTESGRIAGQPHQLKKNQRASYTGSKPYGEGFILDSDAGFRLLERDPCSKDVLFPYLNGEDLNSRFDQSPSRWVINFGTRSQLDAQKYQTCFEIVERLVKPYRQSATKGVANELWWIHERPRIELYEALEGHQHVLVCSEVTKHLAFCFVPTGSVFSANLDVFPLASWDMCSLLQSSVHDCWARMYCSHLETRLKYSPGNAFETFPFPIIDSELQTLLVCVGERYHNSRRDMMLHRKEGLTKTYNRFHDHDETSPDVQKLRDLHIEMDNAVAAAYGWTDLDLGHGFHETKQGTRFTISEPARRELLQRLLKLNHERYAEEVAQGLHNKKKPTAKKATPKKKTASNPANHEASLFDMEDDE